ncbi:hypothetical protein PoB_005871700 [Plakobranchus ocellatus]|uniref:Uncharacterized protein n=1 Tax=Plakobranchus ocellatus TaxID=259542 RepID=A0AAV4CKW3_9GAST|nr:hypothetical protein PoB_005871700 [Plakobranchus ocellatus]
MLEASSVEAAASCSDVTGLDKDGEPGFGNNSSNNYNIIGKNNNNGSMDTAQNNRNKSTADMDGEDLGLGRFRSGEGLVYTTVEFAVPSDGGSRSNLPHRGSEANVTKKPVIISTDTTEYASIQV